MAPETAITMFLIGTPILLIIGVIWLFLHEWKKVVLSFTIILLVIPILYFILPPIYEHHEHTKRYDMLAAYLTAIYPTLTFSITPQHLQTGDRPYTYIARANDSPFRTEKFLVDSQGEVTHSSYITDSYASYDEMDMLIQLAATKEPYDYLLQPSTFKNLATILQIMRSY